MHEPAGFLPGHTAAPMGMASIVSNPSGMSIARDAPASFFQQARLPPSSTTRSMPNLTAPSWATPNPTNSYLVHEYEGVGTIRHYPADHVAPLMPLASMSTATLLSEYRRTLPSSSASARLQFGWAPEQQDPRRRLRKQYKAALKQQSPSLSTLRKLPALELSAPLTHHPRPSMPSYYGRSLHTSSSTGVDMRAR